MKIRSSLIISSIAIAILMLPATGLAATSVTEDRQIMPYPSFPQMVTNYDSKTIQVTGTGKTTTKADKATITFTLQTNTKNYSEGATRLNGTLAKISESLKSYGVTPADISTSWWGFYPEYDYATEQPKIANYNMTRSITVNLYSNLEQIEQALDKVLSQATETTRISDINFNFGLKNSLLAGKDARVQAIFDAKAKATQLAEILGLQIDSISKVEDFNSFENYFTSQTPELEIQVSLNITYKFK